MPGGCIKEASRTIETVTPGRVSWREPGDHLPILAIARAACSGDGPRIGFAVRGDGTVFVADCALETVSAVTDPLYPGAMSDEFEAAAAAFGEKGALLGLDLGEKTIGVASCDPARRVATPVETIRRTKFTADAERLKTLAAERGVVGFVLGLPRNMDGAEGPRAQSTRAFARSLTKALALPVALWDERLSTAAMERDLIALDTSRAKRAAKIDESAATFILQGAIDRLNRRGA